MPFLRHGSVSAQMNVTDLNRTGTFGSPIQLSEKITIALPTRPRRH